MCVAIIQELKETNSKLIENLLSRYTSVLLHSCMFSYIYQYTILFIGAALKCAPIMEWEFILASGRSSF